MAWYATGTVAVTNGSGTVTGTGTAFVANVLAGDAFRGPDGILYEILSVNSNTGLTISPNYGGSTASGQAYRILPTPSRNMALTTSVNQLITDYSAIATGPGAGNFADGTAAAPGIRFGADTDTGIFRGGTNIFGITTAGTVSLSIGATGIVTPGANGTQDLGASATRWRDGYFVRFLGDVGAASAPTISFAGDNDTGLYRNGANGIGFAAGGSDVAFLNAVTFRPGADNTQTLGHASVKWSVVYATTGTINTSDERDKLWRGGLTEAELRAAKRIAADLGFYQWIDKIDQYGAENARFHFGVRAQAVWTIMADEGLVDPLDADGKPGVTPYAFLCWDEWEAEGETVDRFGIRPDQLALFLIAGQEARLAALEAAL